MDRAAVIRLDWALTQCLRREECRQLVRLMLAVVLRDEAGIAEAQTALSRDAERVYPVRT